MQRAGGKLLSSRLPAAEAEEAYRRRQWIIYFVSIGKTPRHIGWDNHSPPDPHGPLAAALEANGMY